MPIREIELEDMSAVQEYFWYESLSALHPFDFAFYINFRYVGMMEEATGKEIDRFRLVEIGCMSREEFAEVYGV